MREKDNLHAIAFIIVAIIIGAINLYGFYYGWKIDKQVDEARVMIEEINNQEYDDEITKLIDECRVKVNVMWKAVVGLALKSVMGLLLSVFLFLPELLYEKLELDVMLYFIPTEKYEWIVGIIIVAMTIYNTISPLLEIGDYITVKNEMESVMDSLFSIMTHESWFQY